jgi:hypothetical protein
MTDKEKFLTFADSLYTFCTKQRHIISGDVILLEQKNQVMPNSVEQAFELFEEQLELARLNGKSEFMIDLLNHMNGKMAELGYGNKNN